MSKLDEYKRDPVIVSVRKILEVDPRTREKDNLLIAIFWSTVDKIRGLPIGAISRATPAERIRRARQFIQSPKGLNILGPSRRVATARSKAERGLRARFGKRRR